MIDRGCPWTAVIFVCAMCVSATARAEPKAGDLKFEAYTVKGSGGRSAEAELGRLLVPENRTNTQSNLIELAFVRLRCTGENPGAPIFILAGGPGGSGIERAAGTLFDFPELLKVADVICLDQRGVGRSRPRLVYNVPFDFPPEEPLDPEAMRPYMREASRKAREHWENEGVDLSGYNTNENADDVDAVRRAIGAEKISLFGRSYGSHLAFAYIRRHEERVHRVVLQGIEGPDHTIKTPSQIQAGLERVARLIEADPEVGKVIPDFLAMVRRVLERLENEPKRLEMRRPGGRDTVTVAVGKFEVQMWLAGAIGRVNSLAPVPAILYAMDRGDFRYLARRRVAGDMGIMSAMSIMMDCASGLSSERAERIRREARETLLGNAVNFPFMEICEGWDAPDAGDEFRGPLRSDLPVLFMSGTIDSRTPISNAEEILKGFPNHEHIVVENAGHEGLLFNAEEGKVQIVRFLRGAPVTKHRIELPAPKFTKIKVAGD